MQLANELRRINAAEKNVASASTLPVHPDAVSGRWDDTCLDYLFKTAVICGRRRSCWSSDLRIEKGDSEPVFSAIAGYIGGTKDEVVDCFPREKEIVSVYQFPVYCVVSHVLMNGTCPTCFTVEEEFKLKAPRHGLGLLLVQKLLDAALTQRSELPVSKAAVMVCGGVPIVKFMVYWKPSYVKISYCSSGVGIHDSQIGFQDLCQWCFSSLSVVSRFVSVHIQ